MSGGVKYATPEYIELTKYTAESPRGEYRKA